ncbi:MAG: ECF-type sigma factor [Thermoanaerobaculia bacterium]|nr:ECF-type sigma factor [Thermoanaerobaculia bacterium]
MSTPAISSSNEVTAILERTAKDLKPAEELLPLLYDELRVLARARLARERPGQTLQPTALVHEAWVRLVGRGDPGWNSKAHFFGAAALAMRRILVEQARRKARIRHGGEQRRMDVDAVELEPALAIAPPAADVLAVDAALRKLEIEDPRKAKIVDLRWFAGLTVPETAEVLGVSVGTVERDWRFIRTWLRSELDEGSGWT